MTSNPKIAVVLSGCGVYDGAEVHESVLTLLAIDRHGAEYECYAPDVDQKQVINHLTGEEADEIRNVLVESARIARGAVRDLRQLDVARVDAVVFPGGFGAAKNLSSFAFDGPDCSVQEDVARVVRDAVAAGKPLGALCIAPAVVSKLVDGVEVTIGQDPETAAAIERMGGRHRPASHGEIVIDAAHRLVTTPCYMLDATVSQIADGAENAVKAVLEMVREDRAAA